MKRYRRIEVATPGEIEFGEILDYFGKCPRCQYPARAIRATGIRTDGSLKHCHRDM